MYSFYRVEILEKYRICTCSKSKKTFDISKLFIKNIIKNL